MAYRLGIDIGTNSIGWCVLTMDAAGRPSGIGDIGVRIYADGRDPKGGTSLAADRRIARSMRRRRDRFLLRRTDLMAALVAHGLMPAEAPARKALEELDPYDLRARGLDEALPLHHLGRALFHLHQRRGFRSNRRTEAGDRKEAGKIKAAAGQLADLMAASGARTLGEFLARRHAGRQSVRARLRGEGAKAAYDFYPQRALVEAEFDALWRAQAAFNPELSEAACENLRAILFRQRRLRPVDPGKCALDPARDRDDAGGFRAPSALPTSQDFRILQELANLRVVFPGRPERPLAIAERDRLFHDLKHKNTLTFGAIRRLLGLPGEAGFNLESEKRDRLLGDETAAVLAHKDRFGPAWRALPAERQAAIVERLLAEEDEEALAAWLVEACGLTEPAAGAVSAAPLPEGHCRLGRRALAAVNAALRDGWRDFLCADTGEIIRAPLTYAEAAERAGYHHSDHRPGEILDALPYYGEALADQVSGSGDPDDPPEVRFGRIANPTVHIGLNQSRRIVNAVIERYGPPAEIVVELARELKLSRKEKDRIAKEQAENQAKNEARRQKLAGIGERDTGENLLRLRLWEELNPADPLDRRCVYTGEPIGLRRLLSDEVEVDHILPFSRTLDNSAANRTVSLRRANREKGNLSPFEAFGPDAERWNDILARAQGLPKNKRWRFAPDAMARFDRDRGFLDRQLTDTAYLSRLTREYLSFVCPANRVRAIPGRMTALLRGKWGLDSLLGGDNRKNRCDHRHHAIDAAVAAVTDQGLLQRLASAAETSRERLIDAMPEPWSGFRDDVGEVVRGVTVSYRLDHGAAGRLHEDTAYGLVRDPAAEDGFNLVSRKPLTGLNANEIERIRDADLRQRVAARARDAGVAGIALKQALADFAAETGVRRVRLLKREAETIPIGGPDGKPYKAYIPGDNHHVDIFETPDGRWRGEAVSVFQANRPGHQPAWRRDHPAARRVMRVHKGDLIALGNGDDRRIMRVVRLGVRAGVLWLAPHNEGGVLQQRHDDPDDLFRWLFAAFSKLPEMGARRVAVDALGRVRDPGPPR
jgi:CRISPR-associated endonuclease Csn1